MDDQLPVPVDPGDAGDLVWAEFCGQFTNYDHRASKNRQAYQWSKVSTIGIGAAVTVCAAIGVMAWMTATLAAVLVVQGLQQMFQWQRNWIEYRRTAETMRQHGLAFAARTGGYTGEDRRERLAGVLQEVAMTENKAWAEGIAGKQSLRPRRRIRRVRPYRAHRRLARIVGRAA